MINNIMLDLETLDNRPTAVILSIGAVSFDPYEGAIGEHFFQNVDIDSCLACGMTVSGSTIAWWMKQSDTARKVFTKTAADIPVALKNFTHYIREIEGCTGKKAIIWGNGVDFDNTILKNAFDACRLPLPWDFHHNSCYRTIKNLFPDIPVDEPFCAHSSLHDAIVHAQHLIKIFHHKKKNVTLWGEKEG